jgi:O-antigen ligase
VRLPTDYRWFVLFGVALLIATVAAGQRNASELTDFTGFALLSAVMLMIVDSQVWLRRAMWAIVGGVALLAVLSLEQQLTKSFGRTFGGLAVVTPDRGSMRSGGPLSPDYFAQVLVAAGALSAYLALRAGSVRERWLAIGATVAMFAVVIYTLSRGALVAAAVAAVAALLLRGIPAWKVGVAAIGVVIVGLLLLPPTVQNRVGDLATLTAGGNTSDSSLRGRVSENLAALEIARDNAILGVGPDNFESRYLAYAQHIGLDSRAEVRGAHSLYLGSLAELGLVGALPLFALLWMGLRRAWQARFGAGRERRLLAEGCLVAWIAFLVSAIALHLSYPRYLWIFLGLAFTAGQFRGREHVPQLSASR